MENLKYLYIIGGLILSTPWAPARSPIQISETAWDLSLLTYLVQNLLTPALLTASKFKDVYSEKRNQKYHYRKNT